LQRTNDDRFARAGFSSDGDKARLQLPLEFFNERKIFYSQKSESDGHWKG